MEQLDLLGGVDKKEHDKEVRDYQKKIEMQKKEHDKEVRDYQKKIEMQKKQIETLLNDNANYEERLDEQRELTSQLAEIVDEYKDRYGDDIYFAICEGERSSISFDTP